MENADHGVAAETRWAIEIAANGEGTPFGDVCPEWESLDDGWETEKRRDDEGQGT